MACYLAKLQRHFCMFPSCQTRIFHSKSKSLALASVSELNLKNNNLICHERQLVKYEPSLLRDQIKVDRDCTIHSRSPVSTVTASSSSNLDAGQLFPMVIKPCSNLPIVHIVHNFQLFPIEKSTINIQTIPWKSSTTTMKKRRLDLDASKNKKTKIIKNKIDIPFQWDNDHYQSNYLNVGASSPEYKSSQDLSGSMIYLYSIGNDPDHINISRSKSNNTSINQGINLCDDKAFCDNSNKLSFRSTKTRRSEESSSGDKGPTAEQLNDASEKVTDLVKDLLSGSTSSDILHPNVVFENNLYGKNKVSQGLTAYKLEILKLCMTINVNITKASLDIINIVTTEKTGIIRVYWRMSGHSLLKTMQFKLFTKDFDDEEIQWIEAFSYFHIGGDGLVHKIRIDPMLPDESGEKVTLKDKLKEILNPTQTNPAVNCIPS